MKREREVGDSDREREEGSEREVGRKREEGSEREIGREVERGR